MPPHSHPPMTSHCVRERCISHPQSNARHRSTQVVLCASTDQGEGVAQPKTILSAEHGFGLHKAKSPTVSVHASSWF